MRSTSSNAATNYGWPVITHGLDYPGVPIGDGITAKEGMEQPVYYWDPASGSGGHRLYRGNLFARRTVCSSP
jgi:glucose/arabinose dehydrogenase